MTNVGQRHGRILGAILLATVLVHGFANAEDGPDGTIVLARESAGMALSPGVVDIRLEAAGYRKLWETGRATVLDFPLPGGLRVDLDLRPFQVIAPDAVFVNVGEQGESHLPRPAIRFVRGTVIGDVDSLVQLSLFESRISGFVRTQDAEYGVGPRDFSMSAPGALQLQVWSRELEQGSFDCGVTHEQSATAASAIDWDSIASEPMVPTSHLGGAQLLLEMAVDSTTEWCDHFSQNATDAQNYLLNAVAQISAIYDSEISILVQVPFLRTFCGATDPYTDGLTSLGDRAQLLDELETEWTANQGAVSRAVAHLFTKSASSSSGGLANTVTCSPTCVSVLCDNDRGYGVTMFPAQGGSPATFEVRVAAHELGHNHSSPHTNCLQDGAMDWISTCAVDSCGLNPWCQATGCFPGPVDTNMTGTIMSTGCDNRNSLIDDNVVESVLRGAAEAASCIGAAGRPGESLGLQLAKVNACPSATLQNDDGGIESGLGGPLTWVKRFTPACYPFQLTQMDVIIPDFGSSAGEAIRIMVYTDPGGSGSPAGSSLVYSEDTTIQVVSNSTFNQYTLAGPLTLNSGDFYIGFFDPTGGLTFPIAEDDSFNGDSYNGFSTSPSGFSVDTGHTYMIRGHGGPVPAGSLVASWNLPCNDLTTPGQDFAVYRGDIGVPGVYGNLACTTGASLDYFVEAPPDDSFFLVVPHTTPSEGSYGKTSAGAERPPAASPCKPQDLESCP